MQDEDFLVKALDFLRLHNEVALATVDVDRPKIRVFQIMKQEQTMLYFATSARKEVYKQLRVNPHIELLAQSAEKVSVRCVGQAHSMSRPMYASGSTTTTMCSVVSTPRPTKWTTSRCR